MNKGIIIGFFLSMIGAGMVIVVLVFTILAPYKKDSRLVSLPNNNGKMTKLEYDGHSYIGWSCNLGGGLVHDPDCLCQKKA